MTEAEAKLLLLLAESFPTLRKKCTYMDATRNFVQGKGLTMEALQSRERFHNSGKCGCQGRGWVVTEVHLEDVIDIPSRLWHDHHGTPCSVEFTSYKKAEGFTEDGVVCEFIIGHSSWEPPPGKGETHMEAFLNTLVAALQAQEEAHDAP